MVVGGPDGDIYVDDIIPYDGVSIMLAAYEGYRYFIIKSRLRMYVVRHILYPALV